MREPLSTAGEARFRRVSVTQATVQLRKEFDHPSIRWRLNQVPTLPEALVPSQPGAMLEVERGPRPKLLAVPWCHPSPGVFLG